MENNNKADPLKIEITQDKLVDLLLHAATREDLAKLDTKFDHKFDALDTKLNALETKFDNKIDALETKFDSKFNSLETKLDSKIDAFESRVDRQFLKIDQRYNWIIGVTLTTGVGIIGLLIKIVYMIHV